MTATKKWVSADSHVNEVPETWERVQHKHGDLAPKVIRTDNGTFLVVEGWTDHPVAPQSRQVLGNAPVGPTAFVEEVTHEYIGLAIGTLGQDVKATRDKWRGNAGGFSGGGSSEAEAFRKTFRYEDWPGPGSDPAARIKDQDADNVSAEVLYPSFMARLYKISEKNEPFFHDIADSYNEWVLDFASYDPRRLIAQPVLSVLNPEVAAADLERYVARGAKGCAIASSVPLGMSYGDPAFDVIWSAAVECGVPLAMHQNMGGFKHIMGNHSFGLAGDDVAARHLLRSFMGPQLEMEITLVELIYGGVFDRFPDLKIVSGEFDIGWVGHIVQRKRRVDPRGNAKRPPAEYFADNVYFTFQDDRAGCLTLSLFGENNFLWASDYPHPQTTWPNSRVDLERQFEGIAPEIRHKVTNRNVVDLYKLDPSLALD
jgi:uncharacterized protein